jgi:branched-chain amino acid aminotransferase/4-amino-4-deoxychorismate lyase
MKTIPADDRGLTLGVGLFETILAVDGRLALWSAHLDRLERGCAVLALPSPDRALCSAAANAALEQADLKTGRAAIRLTWTGGSGDRGLAAPARPHPRLLATAAPAGEPPESIALHISTIRRNSSSPSSRLKSLTWNSSRMTERAAPGKAAPGSWRGSARPRDRAGPPLARAPPSYWSLMKSITGCRSPAGMKSGRPARWNAAWAS